MVVGGEQVSFYLRRKEACYTVTVFELCPFRQHEGNTGQRGKRKWENSAGSEIREANSKHSRSSISCSIFKAIAQM